MKRAVLVAGLFMTGAAPVEAQVDTVQWIRIDVVAKLDNNGRVEVSETHDITLNRDVSVISRSFNFAADQSSIVHDVFRVHEDGSRTPLADGPVVNADSYQAYKWGLQFSVRGEKEPAFAQETKRRYIVLYTLTGGLTPAWDLAAGPEPLNEGTEPRHPLTRAREVLRGWREGGPALPRTYRLDHDVLFPTEYANGSLAELSYRLEYGTAWAVRDLDKDRPIGVARPGVDYRVQRLLTYLPEGRPAEVNFQNAAFRVGSVVAPLILGTALLLLFVALDRMAGTTPRGSRELFEQRIGGVPADLVAAMSGWSGGALSFEKFLLRLAAQKKVSITVESPETDDQPAVVRLRLMADRSKFHPVEREVIDTLFTHGDSVSTDDIKTRYGKRGFNPSLVIIEAFEKARPARTAARRPLWATLHLAMMAGGGALIVKSLVDRTIADPAALIGGIMPGYFLLSLWPTGSSTRGPSRLTMALLVLTIGTVGACLALSPNTPLSGFASLGLGILGVGHCAGYFSRLPKPTQDDRDFDAARRWGLKELTKPRPALRDAWVESIDAMGGGRALAKWKTRYAGQMGGAPDLSDMSATEMVSGPPFTGESLPPPALPPDWSEGFCAYEDVEDDD